MPGLFNPLVDSPTVKVVAQSQNKFLISWPAQTGAIGIYVYAGFDPLHIRSRISGTSYLPPTATSFIFNSPIFPPNQVVYFWVSKFSGVSETFLDEFGSYHFRSSQAGEFLPDPHSQESTDLYFGPTELESQYFFEEIRRRAKAILEDTGETVDLYIKQWRGLPEPSTQGALGLDPNYQGMTRSPDSMGTGFYPGYFPAITMRMRFGALPNSLLDFQLPGLRPLLSNEAWTLWDPLVHENDIIIRRSTGVKYVVNANAPSNYRGVPITQRLTLDIVTPTSPAQKLTDEEIRLRWAKVNSADYARLGFGVASNNFGGPDYLLF